MKWLLWALVVLIVGACDGCRIDNIIACGRACKDANTRMLKYSEVQGCVCGPPEGLGR